MKNNRSESATIIMMSVAIFGVLGFLIYMQVGVWNECRETNSWWYCMNLMRR